MFFFSIVLGAVIFFNRNQKLMVRFLDVGQGDAILISKGSKQILIDGGPSGQIVLEKLGRYVPFWDRTIDVVIATHPDADHIGGLIDVMSKYKIGTVIDNGVSIDSKIYAAYGDLIGEENIKKLGAQEGMRISLSDNAEMMIFNPKIPGVDNSPKDNNEESVVSKLKVGDDSFLFMGDLPEEEELKLIKKDLDLSAQVLKVGHHGSKGSTSFDFLEKVSPKEAVISVGTKNRYGHPTQETLERLKKKEAEILRTDELGDIAYICGPRESSCLVSTSL